MSGMHQNLLKLLPIIFLLTASGIIAISDSSDASGTHTVTLMPNGGTGMQMSMEVVDGSSIELPTSAFTREGYILSGWNTSAGGDESGYGWSSLLKVTRDITLYAQWKSTPGTNDYNFQDTGAPYSAALGTAYSYSPIVSDSVSSKEWEVFVAGASSNGWSYTGPGWLTITYSNRTLTASGVPTGSGNWIVDVEVNSGGTSAHIWWTINVSSDGDARGTVSFDAAGGIGSVPSVSGILGTAASLPSEGVLSKAGYVLAGWDITVTEGTGTFALGSLFTLDDRSYTATAHWLPEANVVILDGSGQIGSEIEAYVGYNQETISLPSGGYVKDGCTFAGWRLSSEPNAIYAPGYIYTITGPTYMTAYYVENSIPTAEVSFDANGGAGTLSVSVKPGMSVVLPIMGFSSSTDLVGWESSADGQVYEPGETALIQGSTVFKAIWGIDAPDVVTVSFDLSGGSGSNSTQVLTYGDKAVRPSDPVRSAHIFAGWYEVGGGRFDFSSPVTHSITLRADWIQHFTRTYDGGVVVITMSAAYSGAVSIVDWGDGTQSTGSLSFTHRYDGESSGMITVTTQYGASGQTIRSSIGYSVSGSGTDTPGSDMSDSGRNGISTGIIILILIVASIFITIMVVRL